VLFQVQDKVCDWHEFQYLDKFVVQTSEKPKHKSKKPNETPPVNVILVSYSVHYRVSIYTLRIIVEYKFTSLILFLIRSLSCYSVRISPKLYSPFRCVAWYGSLSQHHQISSRHTLSTHLTAHFKALAAFFTAHASFFGHKATTEACKASRRMLERRS
jgi:hypothetical protein